MTDVLPWRVLDGGVALRVRGEPFPLEQARCAGRAIQGGALPMCDALAARSRRILRSCVARVESASQLPLTPPCLALPAAITL